MLHELEKELAQVQNNLVKKEMELEKQQCMTNELEIAIQEERQDKCKAEYGHLRAEIKKLKECLEDAKQQQRLAGEAPGQALSPLPPTQWTRAVPSPLHCLTPIASGSHLTSQQLGPPSKPLPHPNLMLPVKRPPHSRCSGWESRLLLSHAHIFLAASPFLHTGAQSSVPCFFAPHSSPPSLGPLSHHSLLPSLLFNSLSLLFLPPNTFT